jgi:hypothetical protein
VIDFLNKEASRIGVTRQSIIKVWLVERLEQQAANKLLKWTLNSWLCPFLASITNHFIALSKALDLTDHCSELAFYVKCILSSSSCCAMVSALPSRAIPSCSCSKSVNTSAHQKHVCAKAMGRLWVSLMIATAAVC